MRQNYTDLTVVLDRSGSMSSIARDMEGGFNAFIDRQKHLPGTCRVSLLQFDSTAVEWVYQDRRVDAVPPLVLAPRDSTPLWDAIGKGVTQTGERLAKMDEHDRPGHVVCLIITDGLENSSREWTAERVRALIKNQQDVWKWQFQFLGANIDSFAAGDQIGIHAAQSANYSPTAGSVKKVFDVMEQKISALRSSPSETPIRDYSTEEREEIEKS